MLYHKPRSKFPNVSELNQVLKTSFPLNLATVLHTITNGNKDKSSFCRPDVPTVSNNCLRNLPFLKRCTKITDASSVLKNRKTLAGWLNIWNDRNRFGIHLKSRMYFYVFKYLRIWSITYVSLQVSKKTFAPEKSSYISLLICLAILLQLYFPVFATPSESSTQSFGNSTVMEAMQRAKQMGRINQPMYV